MKSSGEYQPVGDSPHKESLEIEHGQGSGPSRKNNSRFVISFILLCSLILLAKFFYQISFDHNSLELTSTSSGFDEKGRYILFNFDESLPMSNFLAGIGGLWGVPMWVFYVNRGQGVASFGIQNKDQPIMKFNTAEKAYQQTPFTGFRTLIRGRRNGNTFTYMPFFPRDTSAEAAQIARNMMIGMNEMEIEETVPELFLKTNILYFTITDEDFPALIRSVTISNTHGSNSVELDILDGMARIIPSGLSNGALDNMGRTMEAWMNVYNVGNQGSTEGGATQPFFHISQGTADTAEVQIVKDGHFALFFIEVDNIDDTPYDLLRVIVDPFLVFGKDTSLSSPKEFFGSPLSMDSFLQQPQGVTSRTPCAMGGASISIPPNANVTITSIYGHAEDLETYLEKYSQIIRNKSFTKSKRTGANDIVEKITQKVQTTTSSPIFNAYIKQNFLDNILRGGFPLVLGSSKPKIYHTFSRIHGDMERDYNFFQIDATYFSQGPGNFRDVNQNRRVDVIHTPEVQDFNVRMFLSFIQADGYNPLTVATTNFKIPSERVSAVISQLQVIDDDNFKFSSILGGMLAKPFRIGQLFRDIKDSRISFAISNDQVLNIILDHAEQHFAAAFAQNGFWADHWTYTLDLFENYVSIFPDKEEYILYYADPVPFFISPAVVKPRKGRYTLVNNPQNSAVPKLRAYNAIAYSGDSFYPTLRVSEYNSIISDSKYVSDPYGAGATWQRTADGTTFTVPVITKFLMLTILKFSTIDPYGMGVEMEGGKPGWNDAMNGLPGLLGSGMPETYETLRLVRRLTQAISKYQHPISFPSEFASFILSIKDSLDQYFGSEQSLESEFKYWDSVNTAREHYREKVCSTFSGVTEQLSSDDLVQIMDQINRKMDIGISRALSYSQSGVSPTYFHFECTNYFAYTNITPNEIVPKSFDVVSLPLFLEGPVRQMKVVSKEEKAAIYQSVKNSNLYDAKLKMFTMSDSLKEVTQDVGRMVAFSPGWLENQSVWLHMSYKFYLELLRGGLYEQFFLEIATGLVPFMNNDIYGRSPLEASSFIASSAFPDPKFHGAGFLARLSGSTAEFLSMWVIMMAGHEPFKLDTDGNLTLQFLPILPGWLFDENNAVSFTFLGRVVVTFHNPNRLDTWTTRPQTATITDESGHTSFDEDAVFDSIIANQVRDGYIKKIDIYFA